LRLHRVELQLFPQNGTNSTDIHYTLMSRHRDVKYVDLDRVQ
jgi:hypothetical protein